MIQKVWNLDKIEDRLLLRAIQLKKPLSCTLELTYHCNFKCKMCYIRMSDSQAMKYGRLRTVEEWVGMARQLLDAGVLYLNLTGGECTLYPGFGALYEQLAQMGFRLSIMSNAGAYADSIRDLFRRYPPHSVAISLYGGSNETYKEVTGDPQGLEKVVNNIRFFQAIRVPVQLNFTMIRQNVLDYPKVGKLCQELGIPYTLITDITKHQRDVRYSKALECRLSPAERACVACHHPEEVEIALRNAKELRNELECFELPSMPGEEIPIQMDSCIGSLSSCVIYWNGEMQTCISMNGYHCVKPFEVGFEAAWEQLKEEYPKNFQRPAVCQVCKMAKDCTHNCAGRRFEGTGSPFEPDPYTCQYTYLLKLYQARKKTTEPIPELICI